MFTTTILTLALISFLQTDPIAAVRSAAERETIEAFGTATGLVTVQGIQLLDIDGDDFPEAFVRVSPTYRQTPTVIAYSFDKRTGPKRIMEALAPGRLRPTSGALRDSHASGEAADMTAGNAAKASDFEKMFTILAGNGMSVVRYRTFLHPDLREGFVSYIDLADQTLPAASQNDCSAFEFSAIDALLAGHLANGGRDRFLVALTTNDVTIYRFRGVRSNGTFEKQVWMKPRPADVTSLLLAAKGEVQFATASGTMPIPAPK